MGNSCSSDIHLEYTNYFPLHLKHQENPLNSTPDISQLSEPALKLFYSLTPLDPHYNQKFVIIDQGYLDGPFQSTQSSQPIEDLPMTTNLDFGIIQPPYQSKSEGQLQEYGRCVFSNGDYYEGLFKNNAYHGQGVYWSKGKQFSGIFLENILTLGQIKSKNFYYEGDIRQGEFHGMGVYKDAKETYKGEFKRGKKDGWGVLKIKKGKFLGQFKQGEIHGTGIFVHQNKGIKGVWDKGKLVSLDMPDDWEENIERCKKRWNRVELSWKKVSDVILMSDGENDGINFELLDPNKYQTNFQKKNEILQSQLQRKKSLPIFGSTPVKHQNTNLPYLNNQQTSQWDSVQINDSNNNSLDKNVIQFSNQKENLNNNDQSLDHDYINIHNIKVDESYDVSKNSSLNKLQKNTPAKNQQDILSSKQSKFSNKDENVQQFLIQDTILNEDRQLVVQKTNIGSQHENVQQINLKDDKAQNKDFETLQKLQIKNLKNSQKDIKLLESIQEIDTPYFNKNNQIKLDQRQFQQKDEKNINTQENLQGQQQNIQNEKLILDTYNSPLIRESEDQRLNINNIHDGGQLSETSQQKQLKKDQKLKEYNKLLKNYNQLQFQLEDNINDLQLLQEQANDDTESKEVIEYQKQEIKQSETQLLEMKERLSQLQQQLKTHK